MTGTSFRLGAGIGQVLEEELMDMRRRAALLAAALLFVSAAVMSAEYVVKIGHLTNTDHTWHKACEKFREIVEKESNGRIEVRVYPNSELGPEVEVVDGIHGGIAHMVISADSLANWVPSIALLSVPYMIRDIPHMEKVLNSEIGEFISKEIIAQASLRPLAAFARAPRNLTSNKPVTVPADASGLKVRLPAVPLHVAAWEAVGAKPTPMAFSEVFTSLQQGVINGQENPPDLIRSASFFEVQKYMNLTEHVRTWIYLLIGEDFFQELPEDLQGIVLKAGKETEKYERGLHLAAVQSDLDFLRGKGMIFNESDKKAFADAMYPAVIKFLQDLDKSKGTRLAEMYEQVIKM
ncbi:MAG: TRAP transporter substrate-binding protein [Planctomycetota bacterium]|nr:TRAP transporter substrate-binding protein [Planctomycetota bacterium]